MKNQIKISCVTQATLPLNYLTPLQGELKELTKDRRKKLENSIIKHGFCFPLFVWENPEDAKIYILDGTQRYRVLKGLAGEYIIPQLPVVFIDAENLDNAKEKLLAAASRFGEFTEDGVKDFMSGLNFQSVQAFAEVPFLDFSEVLNTEVLTPESGQLTVVQEHVREIGKPKEEAKKEPEAPKGCVCPKCGHSFNPFEAAPKTKLRKKGSNSRS